MSVDDPRAKLYDPHALSLESESAKVSRLESEIAELRQELRSQAAALSPAGAQEQLAADTLSVLQEARKFAFDHTNTRHGRAAQLEQKLGELIQRLEG